MLFYIIYFWVELKLTVYDAEFCKIIGKVLCRMRWNVNSKIAVSVLLPLTNNINIKVQICGHCPVRDIKIQDLQ